MNINAARGWLGSMYIDILYTYLVLWKEEENLDKISPPNGPAEPTRYILTTQSLTLYVSIKMMYKIWKRVRNFRFSKKHFDWVKNNLKRHEHLFLERISPLSCVIVVLVSVLRIVWGRGWKASKSVSIFPALPE